MDGKDVGQIVDKLADKLGVAVEKIQPLAEETVRQFVVRETVYAIVGGIFFITGAIMACKLVRYMCRDDYAFSEVPDGPISLAGIIVIPIMSTVALIEGLSALGNLLAPLPALLGL